MVRKEAPVWSDSGVSANWHYSVHWIACGGAGSSARGSSAARPGASARSATDSATDSACAAGNYTACACPGACAVAACSPRPCA